MRPVAVAKVSLSLSEESLRFARERAADEAGSLSGYVDRLIGQARRRAAFEEWLAEYEAEHGRITLAQMLSARDELRAGYSGRPAEGHGPRHAAG
jgi:hypothetical protein